MVSEILNWLNINAAAITSLSILGAGVIWVLRMPFNMYREEILTLAKWEKLIALNEVAIRDNVGFMNDWLDALVGTRPYSCHFETLLIGDINISTLSDLELINKLLQINYMMKRTSDDLNNIYRSYWETFPKIIEIPDIVSRETCLKTYHDNLYLAIIGIKTSHMTIHNEMLTILANLQDAGNIRFHSIFGYIRFVSSVYIWPRISEKRINKRVIKLKEEMDKKGFVIK